MSDYADLLGDFNGPSMAKTGDYDDLLDGGAVQAPERPSTTQKVRAITSGATLGNAPSISAGMRVAADRMQGPADFGPGVSQQEQNIPYRDFVQDEKQSLKDYYADDPMGATGYELGGAVIPGILTGGKSADKSVKQMMGRGAFTGALAGLGYSEETDPMKLLGDSAFGAMAGTMLDPTISTLGHFAGSKVAGIYNWVRERVGDKAAKAVVEQLEQLQKMSGRSVDEIVEDVASGKVMAENKTLQGAVAAIKNQGGEAGAEVATRIPQRKAQTTDVAQRTISRALDPEGIDQNVYRSMQATDDQLLQLEREGYKEVFGDNQMLEGEPFKKVQQIIQKIPEARKALNDIYQADESLAPLFKEADNGAIEFYRQPRLEDAEIVYRVMRDSADQQFRGGAGSLATTYKQTANNLKNALDEAYPQLKQVRAQASQRRQIRDAFDEGRKALSMNVDELNVKMAEMEKGDPNMLAAFRKGLMDGVRNRNVRNQSSMNRLSNPDAQEGAVLQSVAPAQSRPDILSATKNAADANDLFNKTMNNSVTAPTQQAGVQLGMPGPMTGARMLKGDPSAFAQWIGAQAKKGNPQLTPQQQLQVVKVLFEERPELVRKALTDDTAMAALGDYISQFASRIGAGTRTAAQSAQAQQTTGLLSTEQ